jgi:hypothetical protein
MDIFGSILAGLVVAVMGYLMLDRPRITTPYREGWKTDPKRVNTYSLPREVKTQDYYIFYGITIRNERRIIPAVEAKITKASLKIWNSKFQPVTDTYDVRWWNRKHAAIDPLFSGKKHSESKTLGQGEEIDLVIAYNQENENDFYRFTIETPAFGNFPVYADKFRDPMPHYVILRLHGNKINKDIYLSVELASKNELKIEILPRRDFPIEIKNN